MTKLCKSFKWEIRPRISLIDWHCGGITGSNCIVVFNKDRIRDLQANLSTAKDIINIKITKNLLYFIYDDGKKDKIFLRVINLFQKEIFSIVFF